MDQNENKNLESVAEKATEVKDEVVEAAKETAEEVKEAKAPEADGDFKEVVEDVKEKAEEVAEKAKEVAGVAKEKIEEAASKVFTEENKAKLNEATEKAVDKVESYNKNNLFEKIFFGVSIAIAIFTLLVLLNGLGFAFGSNGGINATSLQAALSNKVQNLSLYFGLSFFFALVGAVFTGYFLYQAHKESKNLWTNVNVASLAMVVSVFLGNILGGGFLDALGKLSDFFSGKSNSAVNAFLSEAFANPLAASRTAQSFVDGLQTGSKIAIFFYLVAFAASAATVYFYYQKLFQKKAK